jgi:hypothetical protein
MQRLQNHITVFLSFAPFPPLHPHHPQTGAQARERGHPTPEQPELQPRHHAAKLVIQVRHASCATSHAAASGEEALQRDSAENTGADQRAGSRQQAAR